MDIFPLLFGATFGIGLVAGVLHLVIGLARPRSAVHLLFGLVAILVGIQALFVYAISQASTLAQFVALWKYGYGLTNTFALPALLWFVALYTGFLPRRFLLGMTLFWFALIVTPHFLLPTGIRINMVGITRVTTSWGEEFTVHEGQPTAWLPVVTVWLLLYYGYCLYAPYRQWRRGDSARALALGLPLIPLTVISLFHGRLIDAGIIQSPSLGNVTFILVIVPMSLQLAYDAVMTKRALRESEQRLRAFVTSTHEGIWTVDFDEPLPLDLPPNEQMAHVRNHASQISDSNDAMAHILGYKDSKELIGREIFDVFPLSLPENEALLEGVVGTRFRVGDLVSAAADRAGAIHYLEGSLTPILEDGHIIRVWGASRDVTKRMQMTEELRQHREELAVLVAARTAALEQANEQLSCEVAERRQIELELERRVQELSALHEIAGTVATLSDLLHALQRVAETVTGLFSVDSAHIIFSQDLSGELTFVGFARERGPLAPAPLGLTLSQLPLTSQVLQEQRTFAVTADRPLETTPAATAFLRAHDIASFMLVPLVSAGATVGVMAVNSAQVDRTFSTEEVRLAETIAADIAAAVANLHLLERMQETAALEERQRIASELHDSVTQSIYSVGIMAQTVPRLIQEQKLADAEQTAGQMRLTTVGALAQMRTLLFELRPAALAEASLAGLLQQLSDVLTGQLRAPVDLVVSGDVRPPTDVKLAFYRIAQEAFNNIAKHAEATRVTVTLRGSAEAVGLVIVDNGRGFDVNAACPGCMGRRIMAERAERVGARLQIESQPGQGTDVLLSWKLPA